MGLAEGIESGLSAMQLADVPVWISLGCVRLHRVELPAIVKEVHVFADNDAPGREYAQRAEEVHLRAGRRVLLRYPPDQCADWNDFLNLIADNDGRDVLQDLSKQHGAKDQGNSAENAA